MFSTGSPDQVYLTTSGYEFFNRTFNRNEYFYCKSCKKIWLRENNDTTYNGTGPCYKSEDNKSTLCSYVFLYDSVIFPGDLDNQTGISS